MNVTKHYSDNVFMRMLFGIGALVGFWIAVFGVAFLSFPLYAIAAAPLLGGIAMLLWAVILPLLIYTFFSPIIILLELHDRFRERFK